MMAPLHDAGFRRRAVFVLVNVAVTGLIVCLVIAPVYAFFAERTGRITGQRTTLARLNAISVQLENVQSIASETNAQIRGGEFLSGPSENVISADLQTRLKSMVESGGAHARAVQALPVRTDELIKYSGVRVEIAGNLQSLQRAIYAIENSKPYLFVTGATIKPSPSVLKQGVAEEPSIQAQLDVFGAIELAGPIQ